MPILLTVLLIVLSLPFLASGAMKVAGAAAMRKSADHLGLSFGTYRLIGLLEIAGAAGLLAGLAVRPLAIAAAAGLCLLMIGAVVFHVRAKDSAGEITPAAVLALLSLATAVIVPLAA